MGTLRGDNGGGERPQEGGGLPDLPPEWGTVIIPDDPSALASEGAALRRQFRRVARRRRWRRRLHLTPDPSVRVDEDSPGLAVPLLIMSIAVLATLVSLFAVAWPGQRNRPTTRPTPAPSVAAAASLGDIGLIDPQGAIVRVRELAPAVLLIVDGCSCDPLVTDVVDAVADRQASAPAPSPAAPVTVVVVASTVPILPSGLDASVTVRRLADPNGSLRAAVPALAVDRSTAAVLITPGATLLRAVPSVREAEQLRTDLARL